MGEEGDESAPKERRGRKSKKNLKGDDQKSKKSSERGEMDNVQLDDPLDEDEED